MAWLNPGDNTWENAIGGNIGTNQGSFHLGAWPTGDMMLGDWGVNTANDTVWAVLNYNSDLAVIPGPANGTWAVNGNGTWSGTANWTGGVPSSGQDTAIFGTVLTSGTATVTLDSNRSLASLGFSTTGTNSYTIMASGTSTLTLAATGGASATISNGGGNNSIAAPVVMGSNLSVSATTGSTLTVSGPISETGSSQSLSVSGGGELILSGTSGYTGGTTVNGGTLAITTSAALPSSGLVTISGGGRLVLGSGSGIGPSSSDFYDPIIA